MLPHMHRITATSRCAQTLSMFAFAFRCAPGDTMRATAWSEPTMLVRNALFGLRGRREAPGDKLEERSALFSAAGGGAHRAWPALGGERGGRVKRGGESLRRVMRVLELPRD